MNALRYFSNTIPATAPGNTPRPVAIETPDGEFFRFLTLARDIEIQLNEGQWMPAAACPSFRIKDGDPVIERIRLRNTGNYAATYRLIVGRGELPPVTVGESSEPDTVAISYDLAEVPASDTVWLPPQLTGLRFRRKAVVVANESPAVSLHLVDEDGNKIVRVPGDREIMLPISGRVGLKNETGAPVAVSVGGIYWTF